MWSSLVPCGLGFCWNQHSALPYAGSWAEPGSFLSPDGGGEQGGGRYFEPRYTGAHVPSFRGYSESCVAPRHQQGGHSSSYKESPVCGPAVWVEIRKKQMKARKESSIILIYFSYEMLWYNQIFVLHTSTLIYILLRIFNYDLFEMVISTCIKQLNNLV